MRVHVICENAEVDAPRVWECVEGAAPCVLGGGAGGAQVQLAGGAGMLSVVALSGRAYVRLGARPFRPLTAPDRLDVRAHAATGLVVALDAAWARCYRFRVALRSSHPPPGLAPAWSAREHTARVLNREGDEPGGTGAPWRSGGGRRGVEQVP